MISYEELLTEFFASHNACARSWSRQYRSAIFPHDADQRSAAEAAAKGAARNAGRDVATAIEDFSGFTLAEDYHQKYRLRSAKAVLAEYEELFPTTRELLASSAVTRANAFIAGYGSDELRATDLPRLGLSDEARALLSR